MHSHLLLQDRSQHGCKSFHLLRMSHCKRYRNATLKQHTRGPCMAHSQPLVDTPGHQIGVGQAPALHQTVTEYLRDRRYTNMSFANLHAGIMSSCAFAAVGPFAHLAVNLRCQVFYSVGKLGRHQHPVHSARQVTLRSYRIPPLSA